MSGWIVRVRMGRLPFSADEDVTNTSRPLYFLPDIPAAMPSSSQHLPQNPPLNPSRETCEFRFPDALIGGLCNSVYIANSRAISIYIPPALQLSRLILASAYLRSSFHANPPYLDSAKTKPSITKAGAKAMLSMRSYQTSPNHPPRT